MGTFRSGEPPSGGQTIFAVIPVWQWLEHIYQRTYWDTVLTELGRQAETDAVLQEVQIWNRIVYALFKEEFFREQSPGHLLMGYCDTVELELRIGIMNRMAMARLQPFWPRLNPAQRAHLIYKVVFSACLRCAVIRAYAYHGLTAPPDKPLRYEDPSGRTHFISTHLAPTAWSYGPGKR